MKLIIFKPHTSQTTPLCYVRNVRIAYLLNMPFASVGFPEQDYTLLQSPQNTSVDAKIRFMLNCAEPGPSRDNVIKIEKTVRQYKAARIKDSKTIIAYEKLKKLETQKYSEYIKLRYKSLNDNYKLSTMRELIHPEKFQFYDLQSDVVPLETKSTLTKTQVLQLLLPDSDGKNAMFLLDRQRLKDMTDILLYSATDEITEDPR